MKTSFVEQIEAVKNETGADEVRVLAKAMRRGVQLIYQERMIAKYLRGELKRATPVKLIGAEAVEEIDERKRAIDEDFAWGTSG